MSALFKFLSILFVTVLLTTIFPQPIFAQSANQGEVQGAGSLGVARMIQVKGKNVKDGNLVSSSINGNILSIAPYDSQIIGVVSRDAAMIPETWVPCKADLLLTITLGLP